MCRQLNVANYTCRCSSIGITFSLAVVMATASNSSTEIGEVANETRYIAGYTTVSKIKMYRDSRTKFREKASGRDENPL